MAKIIVVTSGKGGVGKTTTSASFAAGLALRGFKTAVIDFDVGLRNLDLIMGCERRVVYDLINVIQGEANLNQALIKDKQCENLYVLAASQTRDKEALSKEGVEKVLHDLSAMDFEYIICDSPAGIETGALMAMHFADEALVVTNPEVSSVRDSDRILGMLSSKTKRGMEGSTPIKEHLLITRYNPNRVDQGQMLSLEDITDILRIKLIGVIPESEIVLQASNQGVPAVHMASFLSFLLGEKKKTASVAKERLQIILAHERTGSSHKPDYLPALQRDLIAVISKYININPNDIQVSLDRQDNLDVLEVKIELPDRH
jgi:septum site-determining protein MinD